MTVFRTLAKLLTVLARDFLARVSWKNLLEILGRLQRANSQGGVLKLHWILEEILGQLDNWTNWLGLHWANVEAAPLGLMGAFQPRCFSSRDTLEM